MIYIHYSNRRHTQKITPGRDKELPLQKSVFKKKIQNINSEYILGINPQISWYLDELLKIYEIKYTIVSFFGLSRLMSLYIHHSQDI